jgi:hypothetical protein
MQNPVRIPGGAITKHSVHVPENADITIHAETSPPAPIGSERWQTEDSDRSRCIATVMPNPGKRASGPRVWCWTRCPANTVLPSTRNAHSVPRTSRPTTSGNGVQNGS